MRCLCKLQMERRKLPRFKAAQMRSRLIIRTKQLTETTVNLSLPTAAEVAK